MPPGESPELVRECLDSYSKARVEHAGEHGVDQLLVLEDFAREITLAQVEIDGIEEEEFRETIKPVVLGRIEDLGRNLIDNPSANIPLTDEEQGFVFRAIRGFAERNGVLHRLRLVPPAESEDEVA